MHCAMGTVVVVCPEPFEQKITLEALRDWFDKNDHQGNGDRVRYTIWELTRAVASFLLQAQKAMMIQYMQGWASRRMVSGWTT